MEVSMKKILLVFCLIITSSTFCFAESDVLEMVETRGLSNGRAWQVMNLSEKAEYLTATNNFMLYQIRDNDISSLIGLEAKDKLARFWSDYASSKQTTGEYIQQLDIFYADSANLRIPILVAIRIATMKFNGESGATINKAIEEARRLNQETKKKEE